MHKIKSYLRNIENCYLLKMSGFEILELLIVWSVATFLFLRLQNESVPTLFGARDYYRAMDWWRGHPIVYGPELSGGSFAPGPFFYILTSVPLLLGGDWWDVNTLKLALAGAGILPLWFIGKISGGRWTSLWLSLIYIGAVDISINMSKDWNASFQIFFDFAVILGLFMSFVSVKQNAKNIWLAITFIVVGLAMQIHTSFFVYLIVYLAFYLLAPKLQWQRHSLLSISAATGALVLTMVPFIMWAFFGESLLLFSFDPPPPPGTYMGLVDWLYWRAIDVQKMFSGGRIATDILGRQVEYYFFKNIFSYILVLPAVLSIPWLWSSLSMDRKLWLKRILTLVLSMWTINLPLFLADMSSRYLFHWQGTLVVGAGILVSFVLISLVEIIQKKNNQLSVSVILNFLIVVASAFAIPQSIKANNDNYNWLKEPIDPTHLGNWTNLVITQTEGVCKTIYEQTGWSPEDIVRKLFLLQFDDDIDLLPICETAVGRMTRDNHERNKNNVHGYILLRHVKVNEVEHSWKQWWKEQPLPLEIRNAIQNGQAEILKEIILDGVILLPVRRLVKSALPEDIGNVGFGYRAAPGESELVSMDMPKAEGNMIQPDNKNSLWFYFNECRNVQKWCRVGVEISAEQSRWDAAKDWKVRILGTPLSQRMSWHHQFMSMQWNGVFINVACDQASKAVPVVDQLAKLEYMEKISDKYFVTPFERTVQNPCPGKIKKIELHIQNLRYYDNTDSGRRTVADKIISVSI